MGRRLSYVDFDHQGGYLRANKGIDVVVYMYSTEQVDEQNGVPNDPTLIAVDNQGLPRLPRLQRLLGLPNFPDPP